MCYRKIITAPQDARKQEHKERFQASTLKFEAKCDSMKHLICKWCISVSFHFELSGTMEANNFVSPDCKTSNNWTAFTNQMLLVWYDANGIPQYHVPPKFACLREGEKLLIQQVAVCMFHSSILFMGRLVLEVTLYPSPKTFFQSARLCLNYQMMC